jgi:ABC-type transport system involved in multi-copper enzyme maturation permease subunit
MNITKIIFRRELSAYFATPLAYIFIVIFLMLSGFFTFYLGNFFYLPSLAVSVSDPGHFHAHLVRGTQDRQH